MSWLLGRNQKQPASDLPPPPEPPKKDTDQKTRSEGYSFDSAALERAAKAAKDLEVSKHADKAFELSRQQEVTRQMEYQKQMKEYEATVEQIKIEQIRVSQDEKRKTMGEESKQQKAREDYQDYLARKRYEDQLQQQQRSQAEQLRLQEESVGRQEEKRRSTTEFEQELRHKYEMKRLEAELRGKAQVERENKDVRMEQLLVEKREERQTALETIRTRGAVFASSYKEFVADKQQVVRTIAGLTTLAGGVCGVFFGIRFLTRFAEARLGKPSLVRETSRANVVDVLRHPIVSARRLWSKPADALKGIILRPRLEGRLRELSIATLHTRTNQGYYRNVLMCGPPGTGKTMFAKSLARHSNMDYAIMTGGDIAPMGKDGVTAMHKVFDWAGTSRRGVLLFVDEADAFLRKRSQEHISEDMRATLNAFLYRTGEQSRSFMLVLASNQPEQFDWAVNDRLDEIVEFELPSTPERERLVRHYFDLHALQPAQDKAQRLSVATFDYAAKCQAIAEVTEGMSGREIAKISIAWQAAAFASEDGVLTEKIMDEKVAESVVAHTKKVQWAHHRGPGSSKADDIGAPTDYLAPVQSGGSSSST